MSDEPYSNIMNYKPIDIKQYKKWLKAIHEAGDTWRIRKWDVILYVRIWLGRSRKDIMNVIVARMVIINER